MSFLTDVEAQAKQESERVIKELTQLKFDAQQVIHVLNALKLEVPKELRELSPIEIVPPVDVIPSGWKPLKATINIPDRETVVEATRKARMREGSLKAAKNRQTKAAKREEEIRKAITDQLSKGPVKRWILMNNLPYPDSTLNTIGTRMKKEGLLDYRTSGFQGSTEWFLPSRPITLETLRDEVTKKEGIVSIGAMKGKFGFKDQLTVMAMFDDLVRNGTLKFTGGSYWYEKPKSTSIKTAAEHQRTKNFGGGVNGVSGDKISSNKEVRAMVAKAKAQGASAKLSGGNHISVSFAGKTTTIGKTPSASGLLQDTRNLKKMGLRV